MAINSCQKGKAGERELAEYLRQFGFEARRGQQFSGGTDSPDIVHTIPRVHIECKRVERGNLYDWLKQAQRDAAQYKIPVVCHRRNREDWVAILPLRELLWLLQENASRASGTIFETENPGETPNGSGGSN